MGYEVRKGNEMTQGSINHPGTEVEVKYDYTVILRVMVRGKEDGGSIRIWK